MARHDKSDDSGDDDFDPHRPNVKGKKHSSATKKKQKKAGALQVLAPMTTAHHNSAIKRHYNATTTDFGGPLPTPGLTPTDVSFASQAAAVAHERDSVISTQWVVQPPRPPIQEQVNLQEQKSVPYQSKFKWNGMLGFEDEVLDAQLHFSRRGYSGQHTSRDTCDLWQYILRLFFPAEEGYDLILHNYREQNDLDDLAKSTGSSEDDDEYPAGGPVTLQVWACVRQRNPYTRLFYVVSSKPIVTIICGPSEETVHEFPGVRLHGGSLDVQVQHATDMQKMLYKQLHLLMAQHNQLVAEGRNPAVQVRSLQGAVACGTMVRFYGIKMGEREAGWLKSRSTRGWDLVNGVPSDALAAVEKALTDIKAAALRNRS